MPDRPSLWWSYDSEDNSFSALPAGPFLLPAICIALCVSAFGAIKSWSNRPENVVSRDLLNSYEYQRMRRRYFELIDKKLENGGLSLQDHHELEQLKHPYWIQSGTWSYWP